MINIYNICVQGPVITDVEVAVTVPEMVAVGAPASEYGDVATALATANTVVKGRLKMGSQYHFQVGRSCIEKQVLREETIGGAQ